MKLKHTIEVNPKESTATNVETRNITAGEKIIDQVANLRITGSRHIHGHIFFIEACCPG